MTTQFEHIPYSVQFRFSSIAENTQGNSVSVPIPYDVAFHEICVACSNNITTTFYAFSVELINYNTGEKLMDEPIGNLNIQADARTPYKLPSKWFVRKHERLICNLDMFDNSTTTTIYITLNGTVLPADPNPGVAPFLYSLSYNLGFQDNINTASGLTALEFNQYVYGTVSKQMLFDYDLYGFTFDAGNIELGTYLIPNQGFQLSWGTIKKRKFFDRMIINALAGGGTTYGQGKNITTLPASTLSGFPNNQVQQAWLPKPERIPRCELVRADFSMAPTYVSPTVAHTLWGNVTLVLFGNHVDANA